MDAEEIAALAAGLGKAMADGLAANEEARQAKAQAAKKVAAEVVEGKRLAEKRSRALHAVVDSFERDRNSAADSLKHAVASFCADSCSDVLETLKSDPRMPRTINYLERYSALMGVQDRGTVLKLLGSTIDLADRILDEAGDVDPASALREAASGYVARVMRLNGICVSQADPNPESSVEDEPAAAVATATEGAAGGDDMARAIEGAFASILGELPDLETQQLEQVEAAKAQEKAVDEQIERAVKAATRAAESLCRSKALGVAGATYCLERPAGFDGTITFKADRDVALVKELSAEVHASFKTFKQVVQDNGLFAAFASENTYGACKGFCFDCWWDDIDDEYTGEIPGRQEYSDIPCAVEEDKGGDTLEKSIARMRQFNKQKYWGLLDDDFQQHVEAFWYGFKKLMVNVNGLFEFDSRSFGKYCADVSKAAQKKAHALGMQMDDYQASNFCKQIKERSRG